MRFVMFYHSLVSDWNHGNAHFLRGIAAELTRRNHEVIVYEPCGGWSYSHLVKDHGREPIWDFHACYPTLNSRFYESESLNLDDVLDGADVVLVHEWNPAELIAAVGRHKSRRKTYRLFFHDTHHRGVTEKDGFGDGRLLHYDGALVFGESLAERYRKGHWANHVRVWHEAADTTLFHVRERDSKEGTLVWIGNWGDGERTADLTEYLLNPNQLAGFQSKAFGVRYPEAAREALAQAGFEYGGWLPNFRVPETFGSFVMTVHVPRRPYREKLPGIPTIRVFEALACGIPLVCSPWDDCENLFSPGQDYLIARNGNEMTEMLREVAANSGLRHGLAKHGLSTIERRHTCRHRVDELLDIVRQ